MHLIYMHSFQGDQEYGYQSRTEDDVITETV